jgi:hypothetical protein
MRVENEVLPKDPERIRQMLEPGPDKPIFMVNLLKFKDKAEYKDGRPTTLSGRDAYMIYGRAVAELLQKFGGRAVFAADVTFLALGQVEAHALLDQPTDRLRPVRNHGGDKAALGPEMPGAQGVLVVFLERIIIADGGLDAALGHHRIAIAHAQLADQQHPRPGPRCG